MHDATLLSDNTAEEPSLELFRHEARDRLGHKEKAKGRARASPRRPGQHRSEDGTPSTQQLAVSMCGTDVIAPRWRKRMLPLCFAVVSRLSL